LGAGETSWSLAPMFMVLTPKCYGLAFDHPNSKGGKYVLKSKGVTMTHENHAVINPHTLGAGCSLCRNTARLPVRTWGGAYVAHRLNHVHKDIAFLATINVIQGQLASGNALKSAVCLPVHMVGGGGDTDHRSHPSPDRKWLLALPESMSQVMIFQPLASILSRHIPLKRTLTMLRGWKM
jgi:hypothetical protein